MEFPFGRHHHHHLHYHHHHHHHHHHYHYHYGREEEEERRQREEPPHYPPPGYHPYQPDAYATRGGEEYQRPPSHYGGAEGAYWRPPPETHHRGYEPGPGYPPVQHVAHEVRPKEEGGGGEHEWGHHGHHGLSPFSFFHHVSHETGGGSSGGVPANLSTVRVFTKAAENYSLSIRDGMVILARADPRDECQHWIKDEKFSTKVNDEEGLPSFALVNKVTGEAIKHSIGATHPVRLVPYNPNYLDESILWTESHDTGECFRCIRMVNNIRLNFDAFHGDEDHGGVHDGTIIVLWEWLKGKNQRWKIIPYCK